MRKITLLSLAILMVSISWGYTSTATLIQPTDLTYLGAFRLPDGNPNETTENWWWGGYAMTYYPGGDPSGPADGYPGSIFGTGHAWEHQVSEISIPVPVISASKNLNQLNTATTLQSFHDIFNVGNLEMPRVGLEYLPKQGSQSSGKLYSCYGMHLDDLETRYTHGWFQLDLSNPQKKGDWYIDTTHQLYNTNDYMFEIPAAWAAENSSNRILATGRYRDGGWSGQGPSLFAIAPWTQGNPPANGTSLNYTTLLKYTSTEDYWEESHTMTDYHDSDEWSGAVWLTSGSKSAVIFVGTKGTGDCWYGDQNGPCYDCAGERGWWSTGFEGRIIFYDPDDLAQVAAGTMEEWEPQPYAYLNVDEYLYHIQSTQEWYHLAAACFDRANGLLYVFEPLVDDDKPLVHVWKVDTGTVTPPSITVVSPNGGEEWQGGSTHSITWTTGGTVGNVEIQYSSNNGSSWSTITSSTSNDGSHAWTVPGIDSTQCLVRVRETDGSPSDTSNAVFTITGGGSSSATISLDRTQFYFGALTSGITTDSQTLTIENSGSGTMNWTATDNSSWLSCSPASGTGAGVVTVSVNASGLSVGQYNGTITVASAEAGNSPQTVSVQLNVYAPGSSTQPFGYYSTPENGSTVRSNVPFTGWVLDDIGIESVKIYRQSGSELIYIGDAVLVEGARPDVEADYPGYPMNYKAGWGYMMLTNFLPGGGNGPFTIFAYATDKEGHVVNLGSKNITCDNANAVKPFGTVDTPTQGGLAYGDDFVNWGWALTPMPNWIATDGSTIGVFIDGVNLGHPHYNIFRSDIATLFPGYANSNGAVGYFTIDTTAYPNGVHNIAWSVQDNAGNLDGIGSRYFTIRNSGTEDDTAVNGSENEKGLATANDMGDVSQIQPVRRSHTLRIRKGFNTTQPLREMGVDSRGVAHIEIKELQRLEIHFFSETDLNEKEQNTSIANDLTEKTGSGKGETSDMKLKKRLFNMTTLPVGSTLDASTGVFYWQPGVGFSGRYRFVFVFKDESGTWSRCILEISISPRFSR